ncbi:MAG TPA: 16S rRNA (cytosine(1402)-N(4))-methyltransferase RsmH [Bdellovibrionota bacterium]|jgi:16S rRNA (cytosine1402-N4)-methyltransferase|nr:16S rRNA (cytosine(1402)-N(4))-methyltransferase RsmH [Bdellovibrionota bacterium]
MQHKSVLLDEVLVQVPSANAGRLLDVTAGGGGHFFEILAQRPAWTGVCLDRDPDARARLEARASEKGIRPDRWTFLPQTFSQDGGVAGSFTFALADLGISSFQLDDPARGMSFRSESAPDFRMDPTRGMSFREWLATQRESDLVFLFEEFAEEPRAKILAKAFGSIGDADLRSATTLADFVKRELRYGATSKKHPAAKIFQAFRMAINAEIPELKAMLAWVPTRLEPHGRFGVISFHSIEDRFVKNTFKSLAESGDFDILTKRPVAPSAGEVEFNSRARSAKLRVIEKNV